MALPNSLKLLLAAFIGILLLGMFTLRMPQRLRARVLEGEALVLTQVRSDFDRDGDIDFLDFTVFSALYEEDL